MSHKPRSSDAPDLTVDDPDDQIQYHRIEAINNARQQVSDVRINAIGYSKYDTGVAMHRAVKNLCVECKPLFMQAGAWGERYWNETPVGKMEENAPQEAYSDQADDIQKVPDGTNRLSERIVRVNSLDEFVTLTPRFEFEFWYAKRAADELKKQKYPVTRALPTRISTKAEMLCNEFLTEIGLGIDLEGADYRGNHSGDQL